MGLGLDVIFFVLAQQMDQALGPAHASFALAGAPGQHVGHHCSSPKRERPGNTLWAPTDLEGSVGYWTSFPAWGFVELEIRACRVWQTAVNIQEGAQGPEEGQPESMESVGGLASSPECS